MSVNVLDATQQDSLSVTTDLDRLTEVVEWFNQFNHPALPQRLWLEGQLALVEGFTNAARHAHRHLPPSTPILLDVQLSAQIFQIRIWDYGQPFDFAANLQAFQDLIQQPDFEPDTREAQWGSILFLKLINDRGWQITYDRHQPDQNCLTIQKTIQYTN